MSDCQCQAAGFCARYGRTVTAREHEWCSGDCPPERPCPPDMRAAYLTLLAGGTPEGAFVPAPQAPVGPSAAEKLAHCRHRSPRPLRDERGKVRLVAY